MWPPYVYDYEWFRKGCELCVPRGGSRTKGYRVRMVESASCQYLTGGQKNPKISKNYKQGGNEIIQENPIVREDTPPNLHENPKKSKNKPSLSRNPLKIAKRIPPSPSHSPTPTPHPPFPPSPFPLPPSTDSPLVCQGVGGESTSTIFRALPLMLPLLLRRSREWG